MAKNGDIVIMNERLRTAVNKALTYTQPGKTEGNRKGRRNSFSDVSLVSGGDEEDYNGNFLIVDATERDDDGKVKEYKIRVVDGKSYDADKKTCNDSLCAAERENFKIPLWTSEKITPKHYYVVLQFLWDGLQGKATVRLMENLLRSRPALRYYLIGEIDFNNSDPQEIEIVQTHKSGIALFPAMPLPQRPFEAVAIFEEPKADGKDDAIKPREILIKSGSVNIGSTYAAIEKKTESFREGVFYIDVEAIVAESGDSVSYKTNLYYAQEFPENKSDNRWRLRIFEVSDKGDITQHVSGDISVTGRWV